MKVLWITNREVATPDTGRTGTWLDSMAVGIAKVPGVELINLTHGNANAARTSIDAGTRIQYRLLGRAHKLGRDGLPSARTLLRIKNILEELDPDVIHVWGTEHFWGLLVARNVVKKPAILEIQGLKFAIADVYSGGLSLSERIASTGIKEIIKASWMSRMAHEFTRWGMREKEMLRAFRHINVHSSWEYAQVKAVNPYCNARLVDLPLRNAFLGSVAWGGDHSNSVFCSVGYPLPFKGLHIAVRAFAQLKQRMPDLQLRIAGALQKPGLRQEGYIAWIVRLIKRMGIAADVKWLGALNDSSIAGELSRCALMVIPSFVEGYGLAMREAMAIGTPLVVSYAGGLPSGAVDGESALFFSPGDTVMCASLMERALRDRGYARRLGSRARQAFESGPSQSLIVQNQLSIYRDMLAEASNRIYA